MKPKWPRTDAEKKRIRKRDRRLAAESRAWREAESRKGALVDLVLPNWGQPAMQMLLGTNDVPPDIARKFFDQVTRHRKEIRRRKSSRRQKK